MKPQNILWIVAIALLGLLNTGCGGSLPALQTSFSPHSSSSSGDLDQASSLAEGPEDQADEETRIKDQLKWDESAFSIPGTDAKITFDGDETEGLFNASFEIQMPYGSVFDKIGKVLKKKASQLCQNNSIPHSPVSAYEAGEIPCGKIKDENWKEIYHVKMDKYKDKENGVKVQVEGFDFPLFWSRKQRTGSYSENSLDTRSVEKKISSKDFLQDTSIRYQPAGRQAQLQICFNLPGTYVKAPKIKIDAEVKKKGWFSRKFNADGDLELGQAQYDFARGCNVVEVALDELTLKPQVQVKEIEKVRFQNVKTGETKFKLKSTAMKYVSKMLKFFSKNIEEQVSEHVQDKVDDFAKDEFTSGKWVLRILENDLKKKVVGELSKAARDGVYGDKGPIMFSDFKTRLKSQCRKVASLLPEDSEMHGFYENCENYVAQMGFEVSPFFRSPEMEKLGCYSHFARLYETQTPNKTEKWWADKCNFSMRVHAQIPEILKNHINELLVLFISFRGTPNWPLVLKESLENLGISENELDDYLEELAKAGVTHPTRQNLIDVIAKSTAGPTS